MAGAGTSSKEERHVVKAGKGRLTGRVVWRASRKGMQVGVGRWQAGAMGRIPAAPPRGMLVHSRDAKPRPRTQRCAHGRNQPEPEGSGGSVGVCPSGKVVPSRVMPGCSLVIGASGLQRRAVLLCAGRRAGSRYIDLLNGTGGG